MDDHQGDFTRDELREAMREAYDIIIAIVASEAFKVLLAELRSLSPLGRDKFIRDVLLDRQELSRRGIAIPHDVLIQRSAFGDRRPTLFCVKKYLPPQFHSAWENVNLTFDEHYEDQAVSRNADISWRKPLRPDLQSLMLSAGLSLEDIPPTFQVTAGFMNPMPDVL